jgi:hypothetical protein
MASKRQESCSGACWRAGPKAGGMRATTRGFEVEAHTVLQWLVEAAEPLRVFAASCLGAVHVRQRQLDAW